MEVHGDMASGSECLNSLFKMSKDKDAVPNMTVITEKSKNFLNVLMNMYILLIGCGVLIYMKNSYQDLGEAEYRFFRGLEKCI